MKTIVDTISQVKSWQSQGLKVVLVTGVFDLLHIEHLRFLQKAKNEADKLIVGIETDSRVKMIKGPSRPINEQHVRLEQIAELKTVDHTFLLPEQFSTQDNWDTFMKELHPDIYAVSANSSHLDNKSAICKTYAIQFKIVHQHNPEYSTTEIINKKLQPR